MGKGCVCVHARVCVSLKLVRWPSNLQKHTEKLYRGKLWQMIINLSQSFPSQNLCLNKIC